MPRPKIRVACGRCGKDFMKPTGLLTPCTHCGYAQ